MKHGAQSSYIIKIQENKEENRSTIKRSSDSVTEQDDFSQQKQKSTWRSTCQEKSSDFFCQREKSPRQINRPEKSADFLQKSSTLYKNFTLDLLHSHIFNSRFPSLKNAGKSPHPQIFISQPFQEILDSKLKHFQQGTRI